MALKTDREKTAHILRRFGLGASEAELDYYLQSGGLKGAIDKFLNFEAIPEIDVDLDRFANAKGQINIRACQAWWYTRLLTTQRPLEQALTVFWHNHFATSAEKVDAVGAMHDHVETLRANCAGRFQDLLTNISKDPAMLYWLDNHENKKGKPNENFAREVMELFTLGIGHYTEKDVQEAARALTGWTYGAKRNGRVIEPAKPAQRPKLKEGTQPVVSFIFRQEQHDDGEKTILGNRGTFDGDDLLGILSGNPRTAVFVTQKFLSWFVYPDPEPAVVDKFAKKFRDNGLDIRYLCRLVMESPEFYSEKAEQAIVKNPVVFCVSTLRQLGLGARVAAAITAEENSGTTNVQRGAGLGIMAEQSTKSMGMELMFPPDVSGWKYGDAWISSATMVERMKWSDKLFGSFQLGANKNKAAKGRNLGVDAASLFGDNATPQSAVARMLSVFDATLPQTKIDQLVKAAAAASDGQVTGSNASAVASTVARLMFGSPEFQFC